jgi:hypothetical protein
MCWEEMPYGCARHEEACCAIICQPQGGFGDGQRKIEDGQRPVMPLGVYVHFLEKHFKWKQQCDGYAFYCYKCGKASGERRHLALCDTEGCNRVQHTDCVSMQDTRNDPWYCDVCHLRGRIRQRWQARQAAAAKDDDELSTVSRSTGVSEMSMDSQAAIC